MNRIYRPKYNSDAFFWKSRTLCWFCVTNQIAKVSSWYLSGFADMRDKQEANTGLFFHGKDCISNSFLKYYGLS